MEINGFIINAINNIIQGYISQLTYLTHQTGVIKAKIDDNTYTATINNSDFTVKGYNNTYNVNDVVDILVENNSNYKVILYKIGVKS